MNDLIILESREADRSDAGGAVGDWQTILQNPVLIEAGDQITLKAAVVDTVKASASAVLIEQDTELTVTGIPYIVNYTNDVANGGNGKQPDFQRYFVCEYEPHASAANNTVLLESIEFRGPSLGFNPFFFTITYTTLAGESTSARYECPAGVQHHNFEKSRAVCSINLLMKNTSIGISGVPHKREHEAPVFRDISQNTIDPIRLTTSFVLPAGIYQPDDLCSFINRKLNRNRTGDILVNSPFLKSSTQFVPTVSASGITITNDTNTGSFPAGTAVPITINYTDRNGNAQVTTMTLPKPNASNGSVSVLNNTQIAQQAVNVVGNYPFVAQLKEAFPASVNVETTGVASVSVNMTNNNRQVVAVKGDHSDLYNYVTFNDDIYVGASQVELAFDSPTNKFQWKYLHTPFLIAGNIGVLYKNNPRGPNTGYSTVSQFGGLALTELMPESFWNGTLGFNTGELHTAVVTDPNATAQVPSESPVQNALDFIYPTFNVSTGIQTTDAFVGADTALNKTTGTRAVPTTDLSSAIDADQTVPSTASEILSDLSNDKTGYFLIDIESNFKGMAIGATDVSRTMAAIVSRYYSTDNYTTGDTSTGLLYTHTGTPQLLQSMRCRVLKPDRTLSDEIGPDNTVFLQVVKGRPN